MSDYDVAIIGSGFGGSIAALRLTEKGYRVLVIEAGSRYEDHDFAKNSFDLKRFLFFPRLGLRGIQRIDFLRNVMVMSGAGVGGGSLVYANTLYRPPATFFNTGSWARMADWQTLLSPYYNQAERMLGVETNPFESNSDRAVKKVADRMGFGKTYRLTPLGIFFGTITFAIVNQGIYYTAFDANWASLIIGVLLLVAVLMNNTFRKMALSYAPKKTGAKA